VAISSSSNNNNNNNNNNNKQQQQQQQQCDRCFGLEEQENVLRELCLG
jgi:hypothetical protein